MAWVGFHIWDRWIKFTRFLKTSICSRQVPIIIDLNEFSPEKLISFDGPNECIDPHWIYASRACLERAAIVAHLNGGSWLDVKRILEEEDHKLFNPPYLTIGECHSIIQTTIECTRWHDLGVKN